MISQMFHLKFQLRWVNIYEGTIKFEFIIDLKKSIYESHNSMINKKACLDK